MKKIKPDYYGNHVYETAMNLYFADQEQEAKEESWMGENYFSLYSQETVDKLLEQLNHDVEFKTDMSMLVIELYNGIILAKAELELDCKSHALQTLNNLLLKREEGRINEKE